ncbi:MAG: pyridoxamine 5'-phosphate oxidase family protein [Kibdelosporangium sp.]
MTGFHEGELAVQRRAGVQHQASRLAGMLAPPDLSGGARGFLAGRELAVLTARDGAGLLWTVPLFGSPGFLDGDGQTLRVTAMPGGPLTELPAGQQVGLVVIDFAARRRVRINGVLSNAGDSLEIAVEQAFGNCPRHIRPRHLEQAPAGETTDHTQLVEQADTFFLGTVHPARGVDSSHRGGPPGFVHVDGDDLWWPDYDGNTMFNSLGNITVDNTTALLFLDFDSGTALHLTGRSEIEWTGTDRRVRFSPSQTVTSRTGWYAAAA